MTRQKRSKLTRRARPDLAFNLANSQVSSTYGVATTVRARTLLGVYRETYSRISGIVDLEVFYFGRKRTGRQA